MKQCFKATSKYSLYLQKGADVKKLEESIQLKGNGGTFPFKSLGDEIKRCYS